MTRLFRRFFRRAMLPAAAAVLVMLATPSTGAHAQPKINPFEELIGKWRGNGLMTMEDGTRERIACDADYSGNAIQLRLSIRCRSGERDIRLQARLSSNAGKLLGFWEEKYFKAAGAIAGVSSERRLDFTVSGNVNGKMVVDYSDRRQNVLITAQAVPLRSLKIDMKRR